MLSLVINNDPAVDNTVEAKSDLRTTFNLFGGDVIEARCFDEYGKVHVGYFDNEDMFVKQVQAQDRLEHTCYVGLNPPDPGLLARHNNRIKKGNATADKDILRRHWLLIDVDPQRLSGTPSTDEEKAAAKDTLNQIIDYLRGLGWPEGIIADSGNGYHYLLKIDLPNDQDSTALIQGVLNTLEFLFGDERVSIDTSVYNASRITKAYGTTPRKGDGTDERPHRPSRLLQVSQELEPVNRGLLVALKNQLPETPQPERKKTILKGSKPLDVEAFIDKHELNVLREKIWVKRLV